MPPSISWSLPRIPSQAPAAPRGGGGRGREEEEEEEERLYLHLETRARVQTNEAKSKRRRASPTQTTSQRGSGGLLMFGFCFFRHPTAAGMHQKHPPESHATPKNQESWHKGQQRLKTFILQNRRPVIARIARHNARWPPVLENESFEQNRSHSTCRLLIS